MAERQRKAGGAKKGPAKTSGGGKTAAAPGPVTPEQRTSEPEAIATEAEATAAATEAGAAGGPDGGPAKPAATPPEATGARSMAAGMPEKRVVMPDAPITAADREAIDMILDRNGRQPSALLAILQNIQETTNYLPRRWLEAVSDALDIPVTRTYRMATFFRAFSLKPRGKHVCTVCMGTACHVRGAPRLVEKLERDFTIKAGETTSDMNFTLETVNCVGACALGPLVILDGEYHGNITSAKLDKVVKGLRQ